MRRPLLNSLGLIVGLFALFIGSAACHREPSQPQASEIPFDTLTVGFGLASGQGPESGLRQALNNISLEGLFSFGRDGRPAAWLAESLSESADGTSAQLHLRQGVTFHDGTPVTASLIRDVLIRELPAHLGPSFSDILSITAPAEHEVVVSLAKRSNFLQESLGFPIQAPNASRSGTGPFSAAERTGNELEMLPNSRYYGDKPFIDRIRVRSYPSVRAAWADLLRGNLDMLYEVGNDALAFLEPSSSTKVFAFQRPYTLIVLLNVEKDSLRDRTFRQDLNRAIDRTALIQEVLQGRGSAAVGPISPLHWAFDPNFPQFAFDPRAVTESKARSRFTILLVEPSHERMLLAVQRQLQSAGISVTLEQVSVDEYQKRLESRDFDAILVDAVHGPTMVRPALWWHTRGPLNYGGYSSPAVDAALESINRAPDDGAYRAGVAAFQRAIVDDPPAIFLAWSERARAVSTRFEVPVEPGRDILSTLRLWRPVGQPALAAKAVN